ncbi:unnamed protein product, partial [Citrullus colocynthis]
AINRAGVTFKTPLRGNKAEEDDHGDEPKSLTIQKADRSSLILKHQIKTSSTF